jgi:hypothetical protein
MVRDTQKIINKNNMYGHQAQRTTVSIAPCLMFGTVQPCTGTARHHGNDQSQASSSLNERDIPYAARTT